MQAGIVTCMIIDGVLGVGAAPVIPAKACIQGQTHSPSVYNALSFASVSVFFHQPGRQSFFEPKKNIN